MATKIYGIPRRDLATCAWGCCTLNKSPNADVGASAICGQHGKAKRSGGALLRRDRKIALRKACWAARVDS